MLDAQPLSELLLRGVNVSEQLELFHHLLVLPYIHHDSCASASLSQHQGSLRLADLGDERGSVRSKFGNWLDVLFKVNSSHKDSIAYSWEYFQEYRLLNCRVVC